MSDLPNRISTRVAELLSAEIEAAVDRDEFGLIIRDVSPLNKAYLLELLSNRCLKQKGSLRISFVGDAALVDQFLEKRAELTDYVSSHEETAVQWRNQNLKTIVVIADQPLAKAASLETFRQVGEEPLAGALCDTERDKADVVWLRTLWDALKSRRSPVASLEALCRFAITLSDIPSKSRSVSAPNALHTLGMFPDAHLADESTVARVAKRLKTNIEMLGMVRNSSPEDWDRMSAYCRGLVGKQKTKFNQLRKKLRSIDLRIYSGLKDIDLSDVQVLWRGKLGSSSAPQPNGLNPTTSKIPVESKVAELLLNGNSEALADVAEAISQTAQAAESDTTRSEDEVITATDGDGVKVSSQERIVTTARADVIALSKSRSTEEEWGGVIEIEADRIEALTETTAFKSWSPFQFSEFRDWLIEFVDAQLAPPVCLDLADGLFAARKALLKYIGDISVAPIAVLAGRPELLKCAEDYLGAYDQLLKQLQLGYQEMFSQAMDESERLIQWLLAMELYVYHREGGTEVLLSPIHPLSLWRSVQIVKDLQTLGGDLSEVERNTLIAAAADEVQFLNVLVLPGMASTDGSTRLLGHAGAVAHLPLFREAPRGVLEPDGVKTVNLLAQLLSELRPFARPGLQVLLINAPRPLKILESIMDALDLDNSTSEETFWGVHLRFRYTSEDTRGWTAELEDIDDELRERIRQGQELGLITFSVQSDVKIWPDLIAEAGSQPAHLTVVFDPFEVRTSLVTRGSVQGLSPWLPTCEYRYNKLKKQILVVPVAEEYIFATYFALATLVHGELRASTATHQPQVTQVRNWLDKLAATSTWLVVADPHRVMLPRLGSSEVIDRRVERNRQITTFSADLSPFVRKLDQQLKKTHFAAPSRTLEQLIRDLVTLEPNGILGLVGGDKGKHIKGALGKLIAMRWYRRLDPSGLAVSLDTQNASRWLTAGGYSNEKADLLGIREENGELIIDVIEVKTHDEANPYTLNDGVVAGHAVDQVLSTLHALAEVFGSNNASPLAKPRREVLREHLYTALLKDLEAAHIERWHGLLQDLFNGTIKTRLSGRIVHIRLASVAGSELQNCVTATGIPIRIDTLSASDVDLVLTALRGSTETVPVLLECGTNEGSPQDIDPVAALAYLNSESARRREGRTDLGRTDSGDGPSSARDNDIGQLTGLGAGGQTSDAEAIDGEDFGQSNLDSNPYLELFLGEDVNTKTSVSWVPGKQSNGFFLVLGSSGSGKTETLKVLGKGIREYGVPVLVLDFHGDVSFPGLNSVLMSSGTSSTVGINPMELDSRSAEETGLYDQRKVLRDMVRNAAPSLAHRQNSILREAFEEAYSRAGFDDADPSTWDRTPPTFVDVENILSTWASDDARKSQRSSIEGCLAAIQELFDHPVFHRSEYISVEEILTSSVRLDLSKLPDEVRYVVAETLLRKIFRVLRLKGPIPVQPTDDRQRFRLFVIVDEAKILSTGGGDIDSPDKILNLLFTEARKFGLGMILASQMSDHFGMEVKANAATWLVLKPMDIKEAKKNAPNVRMDPEALTSLKGRGDGYFRDRGSPRARRIQVEPLSTKKT